jgi:GGDEF domain-containing protein
VLDARIAAELQVAATAGEPLAFALLTLRGERELRSSVGAPGVAWLVRQLVDDLRPDLPPGSVIGRTDSDELAVLVPGAPAWSAAEALERSVPALRRARELPGGGEVQADPVAGVAGWPEHAVDADGLFMAADAALAEAVQGAGGPVVLAR